MLLLLQIGQIKKKVGILKSRQNTCILYVQNIKDTKGIPNIMSKSLISIKNTKDTGLFYSSFLCSNHAKVIAD